MLSSSQQDTDASIRATDTDASLARLSAAQRGYLVDPYAKYFVPRAHLQPPRDPLINIGTYVRSESIDQLVESWLSVCKSQSKTCQIISLGAGSDSRFWRLTSGKFKDNISKYIEIDFPELTSKKAMMIRKSKDLSSALGQPITTENGGTMLHSPVYHLIAADLRIDPSEALGQPLLHSNFGSSSILDRSTPTLLLFECVLAYMTPSASATVLSWFTELFQERAPLGAIVYEMFGLVDTFGGVMKNNLKARNVELPGVEPYTSLSLLPQRFLNHGFTFSKALTLKQIRLFHIPTSEVSRISKLEMLDEIEELDLLLSHYAVSWGARIPSGSALEWSNWGFAIKAI